MPVKHKNHVNKLKNKKGCEQYPTALISSVAILPYSAFKPPLGANAHIATDTFRQIIIFVAHENNSTGILGSFISFFSASVPLMSLYGMHAESQGNNMFIFLSIELPWCHWAIVGEKYGLRASIEVIVYCAKKKSIKLMLFFLWFSHHRFKIVDDPLKIDRHHQ